MSENDETAPDNLHDRLMAYASGGDLISREDARAAAECIEELHQWAEATTDLNEAREAIREATRRYRDEVARLEYPLPLTGTNSVTVTPEQALRIP